MIIYVNNMQTGYKKILDEVRDYGYESTSRGLDHTQLIGGHIMVEDVYKPWAENCGRGLVKAIGWVEGLQLIAGEAFPNLMVKVAGNFKRYRDGEVFHGAYGPRLRDQIPRVIERLDDDPGTRQALVTIWDPAYDLQDRKDLPCTTSMQFLVVDGRLEMVTYMRSNDVWLGLPYDVFQFTLLQKTIATCLGMRAGRYHHMVGSLHLYENDMVASKKVVRPIREDAEHVDGLDVAHYANDPEFNAVDRWEIIRRAAADALETLQAYPNRDGGEALRMGIESIKERVTNG